jgi:hypothetical protein
VMAMLVAPALLRVVRAPRPALAET